MKGIQQEVATIQIRLDVLEERISPSSYVTDGQAAEILSAVQSIAMALSQRDPTKNHFQGIHGELHRRFGTTSYKLIRQEHYSAVLAFLTTWSQAVAAEQQKQLPLE
jgi:ORF6C domain